MELCIVRHGIAIDRLDPDCPPDPERYLTRRGRERTHRAAMGLRRLGVDPDLLLSSPWLRAVETAEIVAEVLGIAPEDIRLSENLHYDRAPGPFLAELERLAPERALCVGHCPHLDLLLGASIGREGRPIAHLKKAGAALVEVGHELKWLMEPRSLRRLGTA